MIEMHKKEELKILDSYLEECSYIETYIENETEEEINEIIRNMIQSDKPDIYSHIGNNLIMIEHFEFDSNAKNRDGSDFRQKEGIINNKFKKKLEERNGQSIQYHDSFTSTGTADNYIKNFIDQFDKHYKKIDKYKERKEFENYSTIKTWFFIEDVSPLGSSHINECGEYKSLIIFQFTKIINYLLKHGKVDKILYGFFASDKKRLILLDNNKTAYDKIIAGRRIADYTETIWIPVEVSGFSIPILEIKDE